jgi:glycosyltransferase involved in cell wall biosynthesis
MKIAIASTFHPYRGGIASFNDRMAAALSHAGHDVRCYNWSRQYPALLFPGEAQTLSGHSTPPRSEAPLDSINPRSWKKTAEKILVDGELDVLLLPFWHASLTPALRGVARRVKKMSPSTRVVALMHNASSHDGSSVDKWLVKRFLKRVDSCITLSHSVRDEVKHLDESIECNVLFHPLYNHYPKALAKAEARSKLDIPVEAKVLTFFGLIRPYKGLEVLLRSVKNLKQEIHLLIAGECYGDWAEYQKMIDESGCGDRIHLIPRFVEEEELPTIFGATDCLVLPYLKASQSGVVATAIHYNVPIIASNVGDLSSSVEEGVTGELVEAGDSGKLGEAINNWFASDHSPSQILVAYDKVRTQKSWEAFAREVV